MLQLKYWFRKIKQKWFFNIASSSANGKWLSINLWHLEELRLLMKSDCLFDQCLYNCYWRDLVVRLRFPVAQIHLNKTVNMDKYNLRNYFFLQHIYFKVSYILSVILIIRNYWRFLFLVMFKNTITDKDEWHSALVAVKPRALPENLQTNVGPECESPCHILLHWKSCRYTSSRKLKPSPLIKSSNIKWILTTVCDCNLSTGRFSLLTFHCQSSPPDDSGNFIYVQGNNLNHPMEGSFSLSDRINTDLLLVLWALPLNRPF